MLLKAKETDLQLHGRDKYVFLFHIFWLQEDRLLVLWSSISHFLSTGSYPIWASSFISHLFIWHLNNSSLQEYKSELWYADSHPVISSAHMVKSFRKAQKKNHLRCLSCTYSQQQSPTVQKAPFNGKFFRILLHLIFKCFPSSERILWLVFESLSIHHGTLLFFS